MIPCPDIRYPDAFQEGKLSPVILDAVKAAMRRLGTYEALSEEEFNNELIWQARQVLISPKGRIMWRSFEIGIKLFQRIGEEQSWICSRCGCHMRTDDPKSLLRPTFDHVIPISRDGADHPDNMVVCCRLCNATKRNLMPEEEEFLRSTS